MGKDLIHPQLRRWLLLGVILAIGACSRSHSKAQSDGSSDGMGWCVPTSCEELGANCGRIDDGCANTLQCGECTEPLTCGGSGTPNKCGRPNCTPTSCEAQGADCGLIQDECGSALDCGECTAPETCGGSGVENVCGCRADVSTACEGRNCGTVVDPCGRKFSCGQCTAPDTCGGGGTSGLCGCEVDEAIACAGKCGQILGDCGLLDCGGCTAPETCGGAGTPNVCGEGQCVPDNTTPCQGKDCGAVANNCGDSISCGSCTSPETCGGGGAANICGCTPDDVAACNNKNCGTVQNNCEQDVDCGSCTAPESCGGGGVPYACGCAPDNAAACLGKDCGDVINNCGQTVSCGSCDSPETCGGGGGANICGCTADNTAACLGKDCDEVTNNCGQQVSCGSCDAPDTCGGGGTNNVCGCTPDCTNKSCNQQTDGCGQVCQAGSGCSPCTVHVDSSTVALYTFEGSSTTVIDDVGQNDGQIEGTVTRITGQSGCGKAVHFARETEDRPTTNYIEVGDSDSWHLATGSVDLWVRFDALSFVVNVRGLLGRDAVGTVQPGHLTIYRSCDGAIIVRSQDLLDLLYFECSAPVADDKWHHVGVNFGTGGLQLYVNGTLASRTDSPKHFEISSLTCVDHATALCGAGGGTVGIEANDEPWGFGFAPISSDPGLLTPTNDALGGAIDSVRISNAHRDFAAMFP